jgi:inorganic pyrophosphatase
VISNSVAGTSKNVFQITPVIGFIFENYHSKKLTMDPILVIIETPKGSAEKFDYDLKYKTFKLHKIMPSGMVFPYDFGFIPDTKGEDGDPLDVLVLSEFKTFPGCLMDCRLLGAITARQTEKDGAQMRNDRFIAVPSVSHQYDGVDTIEQLPQRLLDEMEHFFKAYNEISGKNFEPLERLAPEAALELITKARIKEN